VKKKGGGDSSLSTLTSGTKNVGEGDELAGEADGAEVGPVIRDGVVFGEFETEFVPEGLIGARDVLIEERGVFEVDGGKDGGGHLVDVKTIGDGLVDEKEFVTVVGNFLEADAFGVSQEEDVEYLAERSVHVDIEVVVGEQEMEVVGNHKATKVGRGGFCAKRMERVLGKHLVEEVDAAFTLQPLNGGIDALGSGNEFRFFSFSLFVFIFIIDAVQPVLSFLEFECDDAFVRIEENEKIPEELESKVIRFFATDEVNIKVVDLVRVRVQKKREIIR